MSPGWVYEEKYDGIRILGYQRRIPGQVAQPEGQESNRKLPGGCARGQRTAAARLVARRTGHCTGPSQYFTFQLLQPSQSAMKYMRLPDVLARSAVIENKTNPPLTIEDASSATWNLPGDREYQLS